LDSESEDTSAPALAEHMGVTKRAFSNSDQRRAMSTESTGSAVETLNRYLRGEMSAVETYKRVIATLGADVTAKMDLEECKSSHEMRVRRLREAVLSLGGEPTESSSPWGAFAKLVESGGGLLGPTVAIAVLEAGEDHGVKEYNEDLSQLDTSVQRMVSDELLPAQLRTHSALSALKRSTENANVSI